MRRWLFLTISLCLSQPQLVKAESPYPFTSFLSNLPEDWSLFAEKTVARENWPVVAGVLGSTVGLIAVDYELWKESERLKNQSVSSTDLHWWGVNIGDGYFQFGLALTFGAVGWLTKNERALRTTSQILEVILSTGAVVQLMKHYTGRESPFKTSDTRTGNWVPFPEQGAYYRDVQRYDAVPSGHLATAYATFMVIWRNYPEQKWIPWIGYPVTFWVAQGLAGTGLHWWSDYPIGLALGHVFADIVTSRIPGSEQQAKKSDWMPETWFPVVRADGGGSISAIWSWP